METAKKNLLAISLSALAIMIILMATFNSGLCSRRRGHSQRQREKRLFSIFNVIRFSNGPCNSTSASSDGGGGGGLLTVGTCYTAEECSGVAGGRAEGECAGGFGVCCVVEVGCGSRSSQNCTYFSSTADLNAAAGGGGGGTCSATICRCDPGVCQLRLDLLAFSLPGPSLSSAAAGLAVNGVARVGNPVSGVAFATATRCLDASFFVSNPGGTSSPPRVCGQLSGEHMYVDASPDCNTLTVLRGDSDIVGATTAAAEWLVKVTQLRCDFPNLAPPGCTQWFFGSRAGEVQTFNFASGGPHLAEQDQLICVRREAGTCAVCWAPDSNALDFQLSGPGGMGITDSRLCCAYGKAGLDVRGFDCVLIPGAVVGIPGGGVGGALKAEAFCGSGKGLAALGTQTAGTLLPKLNQAGLGKTICSTRTPFQIRFVSDSFEFLPEAAKAQRGFRLSYILEPCPPAAAIP